MNSARALPSSLSCRRVPPPDRFRPLLALTIPSNPLEMRVLGGAIALFVSLPFAVRAQEVGVVAGRVTDGSGVQPVAAADVLISGTPMVSTTDQEGVFRITGVPAGTTEIRVERLGANRADFTLMAENVALWTGYSGNNPDQYNGIYSFTWGDPESIRWTVGDGTAASSGGERWEHLEAFLELGLLRNRPAGFTALSSTVPVVLQTLYNSRGSDILMASWTEAALIRAEAAVRGGQTALAEALLNDLRSDYAVRATVEWGVLPPLGAAPLSPIVLSGDPMADLRAVVDERARELWLTGNRHSTARRLRRDLATDIDLFPPKTSAGGGDDIAFPISQIELDNNPSLVAGDACPAGQFPGSWR